jgi:hypothetical protein
MGEALSLSSTNEIVDGPEGSDVVFIWRFDTGEGRVFLSEYCVSIWVQGLNLPVFGVSSKMPSAFSVRRG